MSVKRLKHMTQIGVEQMGDLSDSLDDPDNQNENTGIVLQTPNGDQ